MERWRHEVRREQEVYAGATFRFGGRLLLVRRVCGSKPESPVIVEELTAFPLVGQLGLWTLDGVRRAFQGR